MKKEMTFAMAKPFQKNSKTIKTSALKQTKHFKHLTWFIPVIIAAFIFFLNMPFWITSIQEDTRIETFIGIALFIFLTSFILSIIPLFLARGGLAIYQERLIENASFITVQDFNYWREKLSGLSPALISFIANFEIEPEKDHAASILYYEHLGVLVEQANGSFQINTSSKPYQSLLPHEHYFLNNLINSYGTAEQYKKWKELIEKDAYSEGYITTRSIPGVNAPTKKTSKLKDTLGCFGTIILLGAIGAWLMNWYDRSGSSLMKYLESAPEDLNLAEQIIFLNNSSNTWLQISEMLLLFLVIFGIMIYPIGAVIGNALTTHLIKPFKRTYKGNEKAELIFGMKNFINDFTLLNEAEKKDIIVWDEFVVYAVALEENTSIVHEIKRMNEKSKQMHMATANASVLSHS